MAATDMPNIKTEDDAATDSDVEIVITRRPSAVSTELSDDNPDGYHPCSDRRPREAWTTPAPNAVSDPDDDDVLYHPPPRAGDTLNRSLHAALPAITTLQGTS